MALLDHSPLLIGVIHLRPLPGSPGWRGDMAPVIDAAVADARAYREAAFHALMVENFGDVPFTRGRVEPETVAAMARAALAIREAVALPLGFNVLRNDVDSALGLCAACEGDFVRVNVHCGAMLTDQGIIEGNAYETVRKRDRLCPGVAILADVMVKHASPLGASLTLEQAASDTWHRGNADALIVTGFGTGLPTAAADVERVRATVPEAPVLVGSGASTENVAGLLQCARGVIVGTSLKQGGRLHAPVDPERARAFVETARPSAP